MEMLCTGLGAARSACAVRVGYAPLDRRLYLPMDWSADTARRAKCHVI